MSNQPTINWPKERADWRWGRKKKVKRGGDRKRWGRGEGGLKNAQNFAADIDPYTMKTKKKQGHEGSRDNAEYLSTLIEKGEKLKTYKG